jgi:hypothetical protein
MRNQKDFTFDAALELKDAGAVTADAAAQVDAADKIIDLGEARADGKVIVDVATIDVVGNDERYLVIAQFSNSATFASGVVNGPALIFGALEITLASADTAVPSRHELPFSNEINGTVYRYMRLFTDVAGATASIDYVAFAAVQHG